MNISLVRQPIESVHAQWLVLGIFEDDPEASQILRGTSLDARLTRLVTEKELTGSLGELTAFYDVAGLESSAVLLVGLGPKAQFEPGAAYSVGFALAKRLAAKRRESVAVVLPSCDEPALVGSALIEGSIAGTRGPGVRKSEAGRHAFEELSLVVRDGLSEEAVGKLEQSLFAPRSSATPSTWLVTLSTLHPRKNRQISSQIASALSPATLGSTSRSGTSRGSGTSDSAA